MKPTYFATPSAFRSWLEKHHASASELLVGYWKKDSGKASMTWPESVDEALCFGWIDGVRKSIDETAYTIRFTPRKTTSIWSAVNVAKVAALTEAGKMKPAGLAAFAHRKEHKTAVYSFERASEPVLSDDEERALRADSGASTFFDAQPPSYRRAALHWVITAKRAETRASRFATLKADSAAGRTLAHLTRPSGTKKSAPRASSAASPSRKTPASAERATARPRATTAKKPSTAPAPTTKRRKPGDTTDNR